MHVGKAGTVPYRRLLLRSRLSNRTGGGRSGPAGEGWNSKVRPSLLDPARVGAQFWHLLSRIAPPLDPVVKPPG